uniref:Uncharacterized protein n=1 Tax=Oryza barthii TaxID=65489 RepID=A0A0D3F9U2_9ORYZ
MADPLPGSLLLLPPCALPAADMRLLSADARCCPADTSACRRPPPCHRAQLPVAVGDVADKERQRAESVRRERTRTETDAALSDVHLDREGISFCCRTTYDENAITNAVEIFNTTSGAVHFMASNNDSGVRDYDMERFQLYKHFQFEWPVNHTALSPDRKLAVIVGDDPNGLLIDANSGKTLHSLKGHFDYSFASAWSPDGRTFATGNQDKTCRIWDVRNLSKSLHVLRGNLGAIRSIRFTSDGQFMSMAEPADFVHVFDVGSDYTRRQELDFFGEISGMSFSPDTDMLFVGVWDRTYGSLLQFGRLYNHSYLDSLC